MKLSAREDVEAPIDEVWAVLSGFELFERAALRRGAEVVRSDDEAAPVWTVRFSWRGRARELVIRLASRQPPHRLEFSAKGRAVEGEMRIDLTEMGRRRTRITVATEIRPRTLAARLFLQSLALVRRKVVGQYQARIADLAATIEARLRRPGGPGR
jgi:carbon monoxide dehydrogenase subunit G